MADGSQLSDAPGHATAPVQMSVVGRVRKRYRKRFGGFASWMLDTCERKAFVAQLHRQGYGTTRYLERVLVLLDHPDDVLALHEQRILGIEQLERLNRLGFKRQKEIVEGLRAGARAKDFEELRKPAPSGEAALRQILKMIESGLPALAAEKVFLDPAERARLERAIKRLRRVLRRSAR
ncbi:hypothetical protein AYO47_02080 [Planctomyces sp. SCGC AG-212-M04]|nr:hypothetical protein AYO47_02080 [Planctomyces sp. SCGC AG-212-M04]